jgi:hypothetical protein
MAGGVMTTEEILAEFQAIVDRHTDDEYGDFDVFAAAIDFQAEGFIPLSDESHKMQSRSRWYIWVRAIFLKDKTFVAIEWAEPASEMQEGGDFPKPQVYEVWPEATIKYVKVGS